jgi:hypothetical protein
MIDVVMIGKESLATSLVKEEIDFEPVKIIFFPLLAHACSIAGINSICKD